MIRFQCPVCDHRISPDDDCDDIVITIMVYHYLPIYGIERVWPLGYVPRLTERVQVKPLIS